MKPHNLSVCDSCGTFIESDDSWCDKCDLRDSFEASSWEHSCDGQLLESVLDELGDEGIEGVSIYDA